MIATLLALAAATPALTVAAARQSMVGRWDGKLEYRDYQADRWFGLPVQVEVRDGGDGVTLIRVADFDDGPTTGNVRVTTVTMLAADGRSESGVSFRKGRAVELTRATLALTPGSSGPSRWTMIETVAGTDDDRPANLRYTSVRDADRIVTTKEVDFTDDATVAWLMRNRTTLVQSRKRAPRARP